MTRRQGYRMGKVPAVLLLCALAGCADIREARQAKDPEKRRAGERTVSAEEAGILPGSVLTVDQAVSIALKYQPTIAFSRASVEGAQATLEQVNAGFLPQISVSAGYRWNRSG